MYQTLGLIQAKGIMSKRARIDDRISYESVFADPTYDVTFKMLFANSEHLHLLISLINNFLGFKGEARG